MQDLGASACEIEGREREDEPGPAALDEPACVHLTHVAHADEADSWLVVCHSVCRVTGWALMAAGDLTATPLVAGQLRSPLF